MGFFRVQNQTSESYGNGKTTLENGGRNPPDVTLDDIAKDLLSFFNRFDSLRQTKKNIEDKYDIKNEYGDYWSADDIKRAWGKTQRMDKKSDKRKHWAHVIIFQMLKRSVYDGCKQNAAQADHDDTIDEMKQSCEKTPRIKENKDIVNSCEQRKSIDNHEELNFTDMIACGKAESMKGNSEDRSSQRKAELETVEAAGGVKQSSGVNRKSTNSGLNQTGCASKSQSRTQLQARSQATRNDAPGGRSGSGVSTALEPNAAIKKLDETIYIRIPVTVLFDNEQTVTEDDVRSPYKLIDGFPSNTDIRKRKSYAMSFSNVTNNAEWVYEILNSETLVDNCKKLNPFGNNYHKGHLAAAANHRWCREANHDTNLFSNIIPQQKNLNQGMWKKLENRCRKIQKKNNNCKVHVYTGPLYLRKKNDVYIRVPNPSEMNRMGGKVIPTHLFKVIIVEDEDGTVKKPECYVMPNEEPEYDNLTDYDWDIKNIEAASGLTFIQHLPNANMRDHMKTVTLQGEGGNGESHTVNINVRISS